MIDKICKYGKKTQLPEIKVNYARLTNSEIRMVTFKLTIN